MKTGTIPLPLKAPAKNLTAPLFKIITAKKSLFFVLCVLLALTGFLSASGTVFTYCSPFALALCCAVPVSWLPATVIGAAAGYLSAGYESVPARYLAGLILIVIVRKIFSEKTNAHPLFCGTIALLCCALTGFVTSLILDEVEVTLIPYVAESFVAGACAVFWAGSVQYLKKVTGVSRLKENELACLLISIFLLILSFSYIRIYEFSPARILAVLVILLSSYYGGIGGGALAGIGAGTALGLSSENSFSFIALSLGGLLAGLGASHSKFLSALALEGGLAVSLLFAAAKSVGYIPFAEAAIAAVLFLLVPKKMLNRFAFFHTHVHTMSESSVKTQAVSRLRLASNALGDVSTSVYEIKHKIAEYAPSKKTAIYLNTMHKTCDKCGLKYYCWEREKERSVSVFKQMEKMLSEGVELTEENLPADFGNICIKNKTLIKNFTLEHTAYTAGKLAAERASAMREAMSIQFDALSDLLFEMGDELESKEFLDEALTDSLTQLLDYCGVEFLSAGVFCDSEFRTKVELRVPFRQNVLEQEAFLSDLQSICSKHFEPAQITEYEDALKIAYFEKARFHTDIGYYQLSAENNRYCGDAIEPVTTFNGNSGAVLADGMGQGLTANINATLSARILGKLVASGFSPACAIKIVNAALIVKDSDESFSSLDAVLVDRFSGKADFYKAGATCSLVKKNNRIHKIELCGMPVGILDNADFAHTSLTLCAGDIVLMLSDGATQGDTDWLHEILLGAHCSSPSALAKAVCEGASKRQYGVHTDDISALAVFIK